MPSDMQWPTGSFASSLASKRSERKPPNHSRRAIPARKHIFETSSDARLKHCSLENRIRSARALSGHANHPPEPRAGSAVGLRRTRQVWPAIPRFVRQWRGNGNRARSVLCRASLRCETAALVSRLTYHALIYTGHRSTPLTCRFISIMSIRGGARMFR